MSADRRLGLRIPPTSDESRFQIIDERTADPRR